MPLIDGGFFCTGRKINYNRLVAFRVSTQQQCSRTELSIAESRNGFAQKRSHQLKITPKELKSTQNGSKSAQNVQNRVGSSKISRALFIPDDPDKELLDQTSPMVSIPLESYGLFLRNFGSPRFKSQK